MPEAVFTGWGELLRIVGVGAAAYLSLVVFLRVSGKRTLSKLNAFDLVVTVALGSTLASILTSETLSLAGGLAAMGLLIGLQYLVTWSSLRSLAVDRLVKAEPSLLLRNGALLPQAMLHERVAADEVLAAIRAAGGRDFGDAEAVFIECDGSLTALLRRNS